MKTSGPVPVRRPGVLACVVASGVMLVGVTAFAAATTLTLDEYRAALDALAAAVDGSRAVPAPPAAWQIRLGDNEYVVSTTTLTRDLRAWQTSHDPQARGRVLEQIETLRAEAIDAARPAVNRRTEHVRLTSILSAPEFRRVAGPTAWDRLKQTIVEWLIWLLSLSFSSSAIPTLGRLAVGALIALAVVLLAFTTYRYIEGLEKVDTVLAISVAPSREWQQWLADARAAAERGAWRDAVHFTYWCAVSFLEARGSWRPDHTRTPREYLRLLPADSRERAPLAELTGGFERVWYGNVSADAEMYAQAMIHLQTIGCPPA